MLEMKTAKLVKQAIDQQVGKDAIDLESVCRMQPLAVRTNGSVYTILGIQSGDLTILVWIQVSETLGVTVRRVKTQAW